MRAIRPAVVRGPEVLFAGRVRGVRRWNVIPGPGGELRLAGLNGELWERGGPTKAHCTARRQPHHAPEPMCSCGLYAHHPWATDDLGPLRLGPFSIHGLVQAWGCVQLHQTGFRAQWAQPTCLFLIGHEPDTEIGELMTRLASAHDVEVRCFADLAEARSKTARGRIGLSRQTVSDLLDPCPPLTGGFAEE